MGPELVWNHPAATHAFLYITCTAHASGLRPSINRDIHFYRLNNQQSSNKPHPKNTTLQKPHHAINRLHYGAAVKIRLTGAGMFCISRARFALRAIRSSGVSTKVIWRLISVPLPPDMILSPLLCAPIVFSCIQWKCSTPLGGAQLRRKFCTKPRLICIRGSHDFELVTIINECSTEDVE